MRDDEQARPSPFAIENERRAAEEKAREMRIERAARRLARTRGEQAFAAFFQAVGMMIAGIAMVGLVVLVILLVVAAVEWAWGLG